MATISTAIELTDRVSGSLNRIQASLYGTSAAFEGVNGASERCFNRFQVEAISQEMNRYNQQIDTLEHNLAQADDEIRRMQNETNNAKNRADEMASAFGRVTQVIAGLGIAYLIKRQVDQAIEYASNLTEVQNVVDVSFGQSAQKVNEWSKTTLEAFGLNELSAKQYAGTMGAMLKSSGLAGEKVGEMAMKITELSGDMASFYNLQNADAFYKIRAGISGETEPLKQLGINMSVANLEAYALSQGITKSYNAMSQAEQTLLRYNYLLSVTKDAQGDFARTSGSFANQQKLLRENMMQFTGELATGVLPIFTQVLQTFNNGIKWISENWSILSPILAALVVGFGLYTAALAIGNTLQFLYAAYTAISTAVTGAWSVATFMQTVAQEGLNAALLACPVTWYVMGILLLIAVIYACAAAFVKLTGTTHTAFGVICGVVAVACAFIYNVFIGVINAIIQALWTVFAVPFLNVIEFVLNAANGGFNSFGDACANLIGQIIGWWLSLGQVVTKIIDAIFNTNWTAGLEALRGEVISWGKNNDAITLDKSFDGIQRMDYGDAYEAGANWGDGVASSIDSAFGGGGVDAASIPNIANSAADAADAANKTAGNAGRGADGIGKMAKAVDIADEQLQYMRDLAEQEVINRYTTAEIKIDMQNNNNISKEVDIGSFIQRIGEGLREQMAIAAEGVH
jgi:outer membrane murein-binding lipoprotein Lpp